MKRGILATREELTALRGRISRKPFDAMYDTLRSRCSLILESSPVTETHWRSLYLQGSWSAALNAARTTQGRIMDLAIAHHIDPNAAYRDRAIEELKSLAAWSTWSDPSYGKGEVDLCTAEAAVAAVVGLDWLWEDIAAGLRDSILKAVSERAVDAYRRAVADEAWWSDCYHHWNAVTSSGCGLAALALSDEAPSAMKVYKSARKNLEKFFDALGREGGWDEGIGFWGYAMRYVLLLGEAASRLLDDQTIYHSRGMSATGRFPVYFTPNGRPASLGDNPSVPLFGTFYLLVKQFDLAELTWWLDTYAHNHDVLTSGWASAGLGLLFRPTQAKCPKKPKLEPIKVFQQIGWVALADHWPRPSFYVAAKAGDLSANHSHHDMNAIQLQVDGEMMLIDPGSGPALYSALFGKGRTDFYELQAWAHNTIVVAERDHNLDACGSVVAARAGRNYRWVALNAENACGENVRFIRHVVIIVAPSAQAGRMLVVLDEVTDGVPEKVELFWHTGGRLEVDAPAKLGRIEGHESVLHFALASTAPTTLSVKTRKAQTNGEENILHLAGGVLDRALFVSAFSRRKFTGQVEIKQGAGGNVVVKVQSVNLHFKARKGHLELQKVSV